MTKRLLFAAILVLSLTGCEAVGILSTVSNDVECVKVRNLISPQYVVHSETGTSLNPSQAQFESENQHAFKVNQRGWSQTHLLIWIKDVETGEVTASRKKRIRFSRRKSVNGCHVLAVANPDKIRFKFL